MTTARGAAESEREGTQGRGRSARPIHVPTLRRLLAELNKSVEQISKGSLGSPDYVSARTFYRALKGTPIDLETRESMSRLLGITREELENGPQPHPTREILSPTGELKPDSVGLKPSLPSGSASASTARAHWLALGGLLAAFLTAAVGAVSGFFQPSLRPLEGVVLKPGKYVMGSTPESDPLHQPDEAPLTEVSIGHTLWVKSTEVTQREWEELFSTNPSTLQACGSDCPVTEVTWWDAVAWANKRSEIDGYEACYTLQGCLVEPGEPGPTCDSAIFRGVHCDGYRLPTDAEWEYFARAGTTTPLYTGDLGLRGKNWADGLDPIAWYGGNSRVAYAGAADCSGWVEMQIPASRCGLHPVAQKKPNAWGIYDVLGNAAEWMTDAYVPRLPGGSVSDPVELAGEGSDGVHFRALRGGGWAWDARDVRISNRHGERGSIRQRNYGFRVVRTVRPAPEAPAKGDSAQ